MGASASQTGLLPSVEPVPVSPADAAAIPSATCRTCAGTGWVCENHRDHPWGGMTDAVVSCECGAGSPCGSCNLEMASAGYVHPWRDLALRAISEVESAVRETSWGQPTFGPDIDDELKAIASEIDARPQTPKGDAQ